MASSGYLDYSFLLIPDRSKKDFDKVHLDLGKYKMKEMKDVSIKPVKANEFYRVFRNQLYKISTKRIEDRFVHDMNESERKHPGKIISAPGHSGLRTDFWKVINKDKSVNGRGIQLNFRVQNQQKDYQYNVVVTPNMRCSVRSMAMAYMEARAHVGETATGTVMYSGIVGNLAARKLTKKHGYLEHNEVGKITKMKGDFLHHQLYQFTTLRARYEYRNKNDEYVFSRGFKRVTGYFRFWDGSEWIFRKMIRVAGSDEYRNAIDWTIREAVLDETDFRDYGVSVTIRMYK